MTFQEYLSSRKPTFDAPGDVVRLIQSSKHLMDIASVGELQAFLIGCGATTVMTSAAEGLWEAYLVQERRDKKRARKSSPALMPEADEGNW